jgi:hypothetical protein
MAKQVLFELENGKIEFNDDGETKVYTYKGKKFEDLTESDIAEIRDDPQMQEFIKTFQLLADALAKVFEEIKKTIAPVINQYLTMIKAAEQKALDEKAAAEKEAKAKKAKTDETK